VHRPIANRCLPINEKNASNVVENPFVMDNADAKQIRRECG